MDDRLMHAKESLLAVLGDCFGNYLKIVKLLLYGKITKDEFDIRCQDMLPLSVIRLHNDFIISLLSKIGTFDVQPIDNDSRLYDTSTRAAAVTSALPATANNSRKRKYTRLPCNLEFFQSADIFDYVHEEALRLIRQPAHSESGAQNAPVMTTLAKEVFLPDVSMMIARLMIGAWEEGLTGADDAVAEYLIAAVQTLLRNIISVIIRRRKHYRLTNGTFFYDLGAELHDPMLANSVTRRKIDEIPLEFDKDLASANYSRLLSEDTASITACEQIQSADNWTITPRDCISALKDRSVMPSHKIRAVNIQRIVMKLK